MLARRFEDTASVAAILANLGSVAMSRMEVDRASALLEEAVAMYRASGDEWGLSYALYRLGMVAVVRRDYVRAMTLHEESQALARKSGDEVGIVQAFGLGALTALIRGDYRQAEALGIAGTELSRRLGIGHYITGYFDTLSASASVRGRPVRAIRLWAAARSLREAMGIPRMPAEMAFYEPYVEAACSQLDDASGKMAWSEGQAMSMEQAIEYALIEESAQTTAVPVPEKPPAGTRRVALTRREREVAALLTQQGLTNRQIAFELSISEHTVATHIAKIMKKLGLHSRGQITAWVTAQRIPSRGSD